MNESYKVGQAVTHTITNLVYWVKAADCGMVVLGTTPAMKYHIKSAWSLIRPATPAEEQAAVDAINNPIKL